MKWTSRDVRIRPYNIDDLERVRRMSERLSTASLHARFFSGTPRMPDNYLRSLGKIDHWDREAMVALLDHEIVGIAEYVRDRTDPRLADLAVLVTDDWQRRGIGTLLVAYLRELAERRGIRTFNADVLLGNMTAIAALRNTWPTARGRNEDGSAQFRLPLESARSHLPLETARSA